MAIKLLDCTLRDGGYINEWNFGKEMANSIAQKVINSGIEAIEVGFLDQRVESNTDKTIFSSVNDVNIMFESIDKKDTDLYAMIDYGTFSIDRIPNSNETVLTGIRVIFTQNNIENALNFCKQIKEKGYKVFANAVNVTNYTEDDYQRLFKAVNEVKPNGVTMVDTYGVLFPETLTETYKKFDDNVDPSVAVCFHAHNTLQMAMANALTMLKINNPNRETIIDGTISGMGKGAGNAYTELLISYINKNCPELKHYDLGIIIDAMEHEMEEIKKNYSWNFNLCRFVSSLNDIYYKYTDYYHKVKGIDYSIIQEIEQLISEEDKFSFSTDKAENYLSNYYNKNKKYKYVIFDIDGTLLDTTQGIISAIDYTIKKCNLNELEYSDKLYFIGPPIQDSFKKAYNLSSEEAMEIANVFRERYRKFELYKARVYNGIMELLQQLKENGVKIGIATYKREDYTIDILKHFGIFNYCDVIHGTDYEGKLSKYDVIKLVIKELGIENINDAVMVGDSNNDYLGAEKNGMHFVGVTYGFGFSKNDVQEKKLKLVSTVDRLSSTII